MSQEQVYLKGFNKVENSILYPDQSIVTSNTISFSDNPWLSDSDGQDIDEDTEHITLHLKSIHSFNFWQEDTNEPITGGGGEG